ncbi:hypothetical protein [Couchioplanes caeruleus]|uniref:Uncharacterized protein n=2 Tax=Couchioplanes caeruleus TaxID=56438 RepID=A0A1K0GL13_9ACTN|nr:hypothetical protein [Couchioplanes caeruleus]OJF09883.1 hypothetical protein BG844_35075 [Couchioplanes caeruleus subsp. caeruleus]ROP27697.1 hypothetical protein EDD30_0388 [Couchioplanes caeruleus]
MLHCMMLINSMKWLAAAAGAAGLAATVGAGPAFAADQPAETVDLVADAATVSGVVGETVPLSLQIRHAGTAYIYPATTEAADQPGAFFAVPSGTAVTAVPSGCIAVVDGRIDIANWRMPGQSMYWCQGPVIELDGYMPGQIGTWTFDLKINEAEVLPGSLTAHLNCDAAECRDVDPANDAAPVTVNLATEPATA